MSEPDAVPLPREGEVFFDVRGEARSMRLSWYADSRVAVFSIWQGSRCTGTFRLPFADLARMVQTLQSGPLPRGAEPGAPRRQGSPGSQGQPGYPETGHGYLDRDMPGYTGYPGSDSAGYGGTQDYGGAPDFRGAPDVRVSPDYGPSRVASDVPPGYDGEPGYGLPDYDPPNYSDAPRYPEPGHRGASYPDWNGNGQHSGRDQRQGPGPHSGEWEGPPPASAGNWGPRIDDTAADARMLSFPSVPSRNEVSDDWGAATASYQAP
jgi:hypothetical protein